MNDGSSRSHAILTIFMEQEVPKKEGGGIEKVISKLNFVDLAG
jgi:hypothetical protein